MNISTVKYIHMYMHVCVFARGVIVIAEPVLFKLRFTETDQHFVNTRG